MGKKVFISYKYGDSGVEPLDWVNNGATLLSGYKETTARHYVDELQELLGEDNINKGEKDGEDLSGFSEETIASSLRDKIFDSSITVVLISPNMKNTWEPENEQWIPWEISYSLKRYTREGRTSDSNGVLAVVLPDVNGSYEYFIEHKVCCCCNYNLLKADRLFGILRDNMFNVKEPNEVDCNSGKILMRGHSSYISSVKWENFIKDTEKYLDIAAEIRDNRENYNVIKLNK